MRRYSILTAVIIRRGNSERETLRMHMHGGKTLWEHSKRMTICKAQKQVFSSVQFSCSVVSDALQPRESQHARPPCPSPTLGVHRSIPSLDGKKEYSPPNTLISDFRSAEQILGVLSPWVCGSPRKQIHSLVRNGHWWWATWLRQQGLSKNRT